TLCRSSPRCRNRPCGRGWSARWRSATLRPPRSRRAPGRRGRGRDSPASSRPPQDRAFQALADAADQGFLSPHVEDVDDQFREIPRHLDRGRARRERDAVGEDEELAPGQVIDRILDEARLDLFVFSWQQQDRQVEVGKDEYAEKVKN